MTWDGFNRIFEYFMIAVLLVGLWAWQRRSARRKADAAEEGQAVIVRSGAARVSAEQVKALEERLALALAAEPVGELDATRIAPDNSHAVFTVTGADADRLFAIVGPVFRADPVTAFGMATLRYGTAGAPDTREERVALTGP